MSERTVAVWGEKIAIQVYEEHKTVWKATGTYKGEVIEVMAFCTAYVRFRG